jgi:hypothetical protein
MAYVYHPQPQESIMVKILRIAAVTAGFMFLSAAPALAGEITCGSTGGMNRCPLPGADRLSVKVQQVLEGTCTFDKSWWADSDGVVVDKGCNAVFSYASQGGASSSDGTDKMASVYYDNGCKAGRADRKARLSMAHVRHSGDYDSRYESTYQAGYEKCWASAK